MEKWIEDKNRRIEIFEDTESWYNTDPALQDAIKRSIDGTKFYPMGELPEPRTYNKPAKITVTKDRSLQAALNYLGTNTGDARVCVHNFASATHPGGGVRNGSTAQEEALCRCTTLLPCLTIYDLSRKYYDFHRKLKDPFYTDALIYTPGILAVKTDTKFPERLPKELWRPVDVITCAAPNLRTVNGVAPKTDPQELMEIHIRRAKKIIAAASHNGADALVTGAFGCGAFKNPPEIVAKAWKAALTAERNCLKEIIFAIYCTPRDEANYWAFKGVLAR